MNAATALDRRIRWLPPLLLLTFAGLTLAAPVLLLADEEPESDDQPAPELPAKLENRSLRLKQATSLVQKLTSADAAFEVIVGQSRTMILEQPLELQEDGDNPEPAIAISDPSVADVMLTGNRQIRILGRKLGATDLTISTGRGDLVTFQVQVVLDLKLLQARLLQLFPDASINLAHLGPKLIVEGEARDAQQLARINQVLEKAVQASVQTAGGSGNVQRNLVQRRPAGAGWQNADWENEDQSDRVPARQASRTTQQDEPTGAEEGMSFEEVQIAPGKASGGGRSPGGGAASSQQGVEIINLMRIPGPQQVMLMVQVAELNRTAYRQIGADFLFANSGSILGTRLTGANAGGSSASGMGLFGSGSSTAAGGTASTTVFGIFEGPGFQSFVSALRRNSVLKVLAEPNLVAMHGHRADFLAGGEFPVPVPQSGAGGGTPTVTIQ